MPVLDAAIAQRFDTLGQTTRFALVSVALSVLIAGVVCWQIDCSISQVLVEQATSRAMDQLQLGIRDRVTAADFQPPYPQAKLDELSARLSPILARARQRGSGVLRVNLFARDGTIIYSDLASLRGQVVSPVNHAPLTQALAGSFGAEISALASLENSGLRPGSSNVLEAYVPFRLNGQVVGAYELYTDAGPTRPGLGLWATVGGGFALSVLAVIAAASWIFGVRRTGTSVVPLTTPTMLSIAPRSPPCSLTKRELEVLRLMATNRTYGQIAAELVVSDETVRTHVRSIFHKLRQPDRAHANTASASSTPPWRGSSRSR